MSSHFVNLKANRICSCAHLFWDTARGLEESMLFSNKGIHQKDIIYLTVMASAKHQTQCSVEFITKFGSFFSSQATEAAFCKTETSSPFLASPPWSPEQQLNNLLKCLTSNFRGLDSRSRCCLRNISDETGWKDMGLIYFSGWWIKELHNIWEYYVLGGGMGQRCKWLI